MPFDFAARVQQQHGETFAIRVKMRMGGDVQAPIIGGLVGCLAMLQAVRGRTFAQRGHFVFIRAGGKLERLHQRFKDWRNGGGIHGAIPFKRASSRRRNNCRIWCAGRWGARHKARTPRKDAARRNGVDSNGNLNAKEYLRRRGGWRREIPAKSICRQSPPVHIAAAVVSARNPKLFASAIRGSRNAW